MSLFEEAVREMRRQIEEEVEARIWAKLQPAIQQALHAQNFTVNEAADYLHVSHQTVRRLIRERELPSFRVRNNIFVRQMDVDTWIAKQIEGGYV